MAPSAKEGENLRRLRDCPVCIVCGRPGEAEAVASALGILGQKLQGHEVAEVDNAHTFYHGEFDLGSGEKLGYVVTSSTRQGIQSFTVHTALLFHILRPRFVIHAGVCAGYKDPSEKIQLGHVILGENAVNLEEGKFKKIGDGDIDFVPDYNIVSVRAGDMQAFADDGARPGCHYGDFISGSAVRGDAPIIFEKIRKEVKRNAIALDMEASAFLELCQYYFKDSACLGVVKGVSDFGDEFKGDDPNAKQKALQNTATALREWITTRISSIYWDTDYSKEPAAEIVPGYYDNFVRRVMDNVTQGLPVTKKAAHEQPNQKSPQRRPARVDFDQHAIAGLKIVLPKDNQPRQYSTLGPISALCKKHDIIEVEVGGDHGKRGLYYKQGFLVDFPRTVNRYADTYDAPYQVKVFGELLKKKEYFDVAAESIKATIFSWDEFVVWLEQPPPEGQTNGGVPAKTESGHANGVNKPEAVPKARSLSRLRSMFLRNKVAA